MSPHNVVPSLASDDKTLPPDMTMVEWHDIDEDTIRFMGEEDGSHFWVSERENDVCLLIGIDDDPVRAGIEGFNLRCATAQQIAEQGLDSRHGSPEGPVYLVAYLLPAWIDGEGVTESEGNLIEGTSIFENNGTQILSIPSDKVDSEGMFLDNDGEPFKLVTHS